MTLPKLYTLQNIPIVGYTFTFDQQCPECKRRLKSVCSPDLFIEHLPNCQLIQDEEGHLYLSEALLSRFTAVNPKGFSCSQIVPKSDSQFAILHPDIQDLPRMFYVSISSTLDGEWAYFIKSSKCKTCGYPKSAGKKTDTLYEINPVGDISGLKTRLVYQELWNGEDIFYHSEYDRPIIITQKVADVLIEFGETRIEEIADRDKASIQTYMPNLAMHYENIGWKHAPCSILGPADWINQEIS